MFQQSLEDLNGSTADIEASALISTDGLMIASALPDGMDGVRIGAMSAALQARLATLHKAGRHVCLRKLSAMLAIGRPFEARFVVRNSVIFHPSDRWVASNTPMLLVERVGLSDALAAAVILREIDTVQAETGRFSPACHCLTVERTQGGLGI